MSDNDLYSELFHTLHGLTSAQEDLIPLLDEIDHAVASGSLPADERAALFAEAASFLRAFAPSVPAFVQEIAVARLLTLCVEPTGNSDDRDLPFFVSRLRENLAELLDALPEEDRAKAINRALNICVAALDTMRPESACWTIQRLGQRRWDIVERLRQIVLTEDNEKGDTALSTLASFGLEPNDRRWAVTEANARATRRFNYALLGALRLLHDPTSMEAVTEGWMTLESGDAFFSPAADALNVYAHIAEADSENESLQDRAWRLTTQAEEQNDALRARVRLGSGIAPKINSRHVVPELVWRLINEASGDGSAARKGYLTGLRLSECVRPRHLDSWLNAEVGALTIALESAARRDTRDPGRVMSEPMREKEAAWDILLRAGARELLGWSENAVGEETNPFVRLAILERLACFRLPQLPGFAARWIQESHRHKRNDDSGRWAYVSGAIELAHSQMSHEAFNALLLCGFSLDGFAAEKTASALSGVAQALARDGDRSVIDALWFRTDQQFPHHQRSAAAEALVGLAASGLLAPGFSQQLLDAASEEEREVHERSLFIEALAHLGRAAAPHHALALIEEWASRDDWHGVRSLECLALWGMLDEYEALIESRLGLRRRSGIWRVAPDAPASEWAPHITGILFLNTPPAFAHALADWLTHDRWGVSDQVLNILGTFHHRYPGERLPTPVIEALITATREHHTPRRANPDLLDALANFAPDALVESDWAGSWSEWLPLGRARFADALARLAGDDAREQEIVRQLLLLGADPASRVRRAAFRALGRVRNGAVLARHVEALAEFDDPRLRTRAAEAMGWIPAGQDELFETLKRTRDKLATDADRRVRTALNQAVKDRMERRAAAFALERVRSVRGAKDNGDILSAWPFGEALARLGDDDAYRALREHLNATELPRHVRFWIWRLLKAMDESWRKRDKEQPESWIPWDGEIRTGSGRAHLPGGDALELTYAIWVKPAGLPGEKHSWGGSMRLLEPPRGYDLIQAPFELEIEGGARGTVIPTHVYGIDVAVTGTGPFPKH